MESDVLVHTKGGTFRGIAKGGVRLFRGIRFATAGRWKPPSPVPPCHDMQDATAFGPDCPQRATIALGARTTEQSEDCHNLNIWTPAVADRFLPVMVWIYGGSFLFGSPSEDRADGMSFARDGVVYVTVNYRVGLFGFLAHPTLTAESPDRVSGNYGLLDQIEGLRWVRENIDRFGGDPDRITVFGVSAGAASIALLMTSPLAHGLFHQAILQSPGSFRPLSTLSEAEAAGQALGDDIAALRALSSVELLARQPLLVPPTRGLTAPRVLRPIQDGYVVPEDERAAYRSGRCMRIPLIVGCNSEEGSNAITSWPVRSVAQFHALLDKDFGRHAAAARAAYPVSSDADVGPALAAVFGDTQFAYAARGLAAAMAVLEPNTFRYVFTRTRPGAASGPKHSEEVSYVFDRPELPPRDAVDHVIDDVDIGVARAMHAAWVRFASTGSPAGAVDWKPCDATGTPMLEFGDAIMMRPDWRDAEMTFLDAVFAPDEVPHAIG